jgi:23S rRNA pseudouridine1911/1915/1917 synthase
MLKAVEFCWICEEDSLEEALKKTLGCSGQQIKKYFSSKQQQKPVKLRDVISLPLNLVNHLKINPIYEGPEVKILLEDRHFIVIHKPPGVHCHPHSYEDKDTILNFLVTKKKWDVLNTNIQNYDRGLLYRLDYETSGVLLLARNEEKFQLMRDNFSHLMKRKFYWAVVEGEFNKEGKWTHYFRPTGPKGVKQKVSDQYLEFGHEGSLSVLKVMSTKNRSLLLVHLKTGLRHQIRAQLSFLGFPILGDELYGGQQAERLFLHALRYETSEIYEDPGPELFSLFFDLNRALEVSHDMFGRL